MIFSRRCCILLGVALATGAAHAQSCANYFDRALKLSAELKHPAEFRVHAATVLNGEIRGEELFGAGGIARGYKGDALEGTANFHWVERRTAGQPADPMFYVVRKEQVQVRLYREYNRIMMHITGGRTPIILEPQCSRDLIYATGSPTELGLPIWIHQLPLSSDSSLLRKCGHNSAQ